MTKPKHPTARSIRTGQTIYQVCCYYDRGYVPFIGSVTVGSKSTPDPSRGDRASTASPRYLRRALSGMDPWLRMYLFYSPRRAETFRKQLEKQR